MRIERFGPPEGARGYPPLSLAVRHGDTLYVSGLAPTDASGAVVPGGFAEQFAQVVRNLREVFSRAGTGFDRLLKVNVLLTRAGDVAEMNRLYAALFPPEALPARTTCVVAALPHPDFLLEIECVAACG